MSGDPFVHLHVASGHSPRHGANHPSELVERAAEHGMSALALPDRDGLSGAVKFAVAWRTSGWPATEPMARSSPKIGRMAASRHAR